MNTFDYWCISEVVELRFKKKMKSEFRERINKLKGFMSKFFERKNFEMKLFKWTIVCFS